MTRAMLAILAKVLLLISVSSSTYALEPVTLQLKWQHQFQFAGYYAAKQQGYYQAAGLDVTFKPGSAVDNPINIVLSGEAEYGVSSSDLILARHANNPVVALAVIFQHSPYALIALDGKGIDSVHDLAGKCIAYEEGADEILAYLVYSGIEFNVKNTIPTPIVPKTFIDEGCAARTAYVTTETFYLEKNNIPHMMFTPRSVGIDFYGDNLFTTEAELDRNPERVKAFRQASLQGWEYALSHPEAVMDLIIEEYNSSVTKEQLQYEFKKMLGLIHPELIELGYMLPGRWQHIAETYTNLGMLPEDISLEGFLYDPDPKVNLKPYYLGGTTGIIILAVVTLVAWRKDRLNKKLDALLAIKSKYANVGEIFDNITHQWQQPLNHLGIQIMRIEQFNTASNPNQKDIEELLEKSNETIQFLADTTDVFRDFYKLSDHSQAFSADQTIGFTLQLMEDSFNSIGVHQTVDLEENIVLIGNASELSHAFLSLLVNARNILRDREIEQPTLRISLIKKNSTAIIRLEDNGGGINIHPVDNIFKRGVSSQSESNAAGNGLDIARKLINEKFDGSLTAANTEKGAMFTIKIPINTEV